MTASKLFLAVIPPTTMIVVVVFMPGIEHWLAALGKTAQAKLMLGRIGLALPYATAAVIGTIFLFAANGAVGIKAAGWGVVSGNGVAILIAVLREGVRLAGIAGDVPAGQSVLGYADPATMLGASTTFLSGVFALRVATKGNAAFAKAAPRWIGGKRAVHGEADWMKVQDAAKLFPDPGGIVVGERYRVDRDTVAAVSFRADDASIWGAGGKSPLLCFDGSFGSSHGIVFAGSGGFNTTSVTIPTSLKWGGGLVVLDPSSEVAPMVSEHRCKAGRKVIILDPSASDVGFNALDWIGRHGSTKEEDIVAVATWMMTDNPRSVDTLLVFLDLLEGNAELACQRLLGDALKLSLQLDTGADFDIDRIRGFPRITQLSASLRLWARHHGYACDGGRIAYRLRPAQGHLPACA